MVNFITQNLVLMVNPIKGYNMHDCRKKLLLMLRGVNKNTPVLRSLMAMLLLSKYL